VPFALVQGVGKPDLTAKLHLIELPAYLAALWWLTKAHGIEGAAIAWTARATFDAIVLMVLAKRLLPVRVALSSKTVLLAVSAFVTLGLAAVLQGLVLKGFFLVVTILTFSFVAWFVLLSREERNLAQGFHRIWANPEYDSTEVQ
jgi:O-antigen/teichoic acid export membrane protein